MSKTDEKASIFCKRKHIQVVFDYCLDQKLPFQVSPRTISADEWEIELEITSMKQAIALGMFVKENKLEMPGFAEFSKPKTNGTAKKSEEKNTVEFLEPTMPAPAKEEAPATLGLV